MGHANSNTFIPRQVESLQGAKVSSIGAGSHYTAAVAGFVKKIYKKIKKVGRAKKKSSWNNLLLRFFLKKFFETFCKAIIKKDSLKCLALFNCVYLDLKLG